MEKHRWFGHEHASFRYEIPILPLQKRRKKTPTLVCLMNKRGNEANLKQISIFLDEESFIYNST